MNSIAIIPARYASSRFPGKPLADLGGKPVIQRVYEQALMVFENVVVATDDERISAVVREFGGNAVMTSVSHKSGTDRCAEALKLYEQMHSAVYDIIVNIQGDEPFIQPSQLQLIKSGLAKAGTQIATLARPARNAEELFDHNKPKVVLDKNNGAIYFSRSVIPYVRGAGSAEWLDHHNFYIHIGLYGFLREVLTTITELEPTALEKAESLEQLRWIENGYRIQVGITDVESYGIDTPEDLVKAQEILGKDKRQRQ
jgi:3-deoxy-manno-octulosonate cytidylyltransferase (CMP-KDO synthetase)